MINNKNKEKIRGDKARVGEISNLVSHILCMINAKRLFKSFGVQSWGGEIGSHTGLISRRRIPRLAGSSFPTEIPSPAHKL